MMTTTHYRPAPRGPLGWSGVALAAYLGLAAGGADAQSTAAEPQTISLRGPFHSASDWHVTAEQPNPDYEGPPARICFWTDSGRRTDACRDSTATLANGHTYPFQVLKELSVVSLATAKGRAEPGLLIATAHRGTQDGLVRLEIWIYRRDVDRFVDATPPALPVLTMQSEYRVLADTARAGTPALFVVANRIWNFEAGESLFSPHRFKVRIYRFDRTQRRYRYVEEYVTRGKYASLDDAAEIQVIGPESAEIRRRVARRTPPR